MRLPYYNIGNKSIAALSRDIAKDSRLVRFGKDEAKAEWVKLTGTNSDSRVRK